MRSDLELIIKKMPSSWKHINLYALGDIHVGSEQYDEEATKKKIKIIRDDPYGLVTLCGDLADYGLKNSVSNVYRQAMSPDAQQAYLLELFEPIKEKIVSAVPGNHEERIVREVGLCPLYDLCVLWGIPDVYRENVAILKLTFGKYKNGPGQNSFVGITTHGSTKNKHHKFLGGWDCIDWSVSGHNHSPSYSPGARIRVNSQKETAQLVPFKEIVVDAHLKPGGYSIKKEYEIPPPPELQYLELTTKRSQKNGENKVHKVINYHSIQI